MFTFASAERAEHVSLWPWTESASLLILRDKSLGSKRMIRVRLHASVVRFWTLHIGFDVTASSEGRPHVIAIDVAKPPKAIEECPFVIQRVGFTFGSWPMVSFCTWRQAGRFEARADIT
jgi:hypothetical protein